ncbi:Alpha-N-arabinofuranosidase [uncultured Ruminococcus sp.]|nr:Alpha-N-arabinofuranosidase [uncultured Ruminococcus sp.]
MTHITVHSNRIKSTVDRKIFGHFTEHAFRNIYGGMYDPQSSIADENGFRKDVLDALRQVRVPLLRYPGGNFVSNYHWEDGIGPKSERRRVFEYAWLTEESNQFGTADFIELCRKVGAEPLICVNMGSGTVEEAMHWVEYCNGTGNTYYANLRRSHGYEEPFGVKYWGLGNEMYGMWQMKHQSAQAYAEAALEYAKGMKWVDPGISLIACGYEQSADWNYTVAKEIGSLIDYISAHHYSVGWGPFQKDDYLGCLYIPEYMNRLTNLTLSAVNAGLNDVTDHIKVAWDEWNLFGWIFNGVDDDASYTMQDVITTALVLNFFIQNSDKIGMANYSTFVNINGAVSTHDDQMVKRAQFYVFDLIGNHTGSQAVEVYEEGEAMDIKVSQGKKIGRPDLGIDLTKTDDTVEEKWVKVNAVDCAATIDESGMLYLSLINKLPDRDADVVIDLDGWKEFEVACSAEIYHDDLSACNTLEHPDTVSIREGAQPMVSGNRLEVTLKKHSVNLIQLQKK